MERRTDDLRMPIEQKQSDHSLPRTESETRQECEVAQEMFTDKLELSVSPQLDRVHRLNAKLNSPIIARRTVYNDKETIMKAKRKLKGSTVFTGEDFSK